MDTNRKHQVALSEKWKLIPKKWRGWWWENFLGDVSIDSPPAEVEDASDARAIFLSAIADLLFDQLEVQMNLHLGFPSVRCPYGDAVFLHQTHLLPYDDLLASRGNYCFQTASPGNTGRSWVDSCRPDYPSSCYILSNPEFKCSPKVIANSSGVYILCCEQHAKRTNMRYVHVPINPTGSLSSRNPNQFSPLQARSRVIRRGKRNAYSDTFETVRMQGGFDGIDSCYVTTHGRYVDIDNLTAKRDALSISGRQDIRHHVLSLCSSRDPMNRLPKNCVLQKIKSAEEAYPNVGASAAQELSGATYVGLEDAVALQEEVYNEHPLTLDKYATSGADSVLATQQVSFVPPWPFKYVRIHPYDSYGEQFCDVRRVDHHSFQLWTLTAALMCVDELIPIFTAALKTTTDPQGYLLSLVWGEIKTKGACAKQTEYTLSGLNPAAILQKILPGSPPVFHWPTQHIDHFIDEPWCPASCLSELAILQYTRPGITFSFEPEPQGSTPDWIPVLVVARRPPLGNGAKRNGLDWDGMIYARHGGLKHTDWWVQCSSGVRFARTPRGCSWTMEDVFLVVYKKFVPVSVATLMYRYLSCLGGQTKVYCKDHACPLVMLPNSLDSSTSSCCCDNSCLKTGQRNWVCATDLCKEAISYACPQPNCSIGTCRDHLALFLDGSVQCSTFLLGHSTCQEDVGLFRTRVPVYREDATHDQEAEDGIIMDPPYYSQQREARAEGADGNEIARCLPWDREEDLVWEDDLFNNLGPYENFDTPDDLVDQTNGHPQEEKWNMGIGPDGRLQYTDAVNIDPTNPDYPFAMSAVEQDRPLEAKLSMASGEPVSVPMHIMLNRHGHLLVRTNSKLRMRRAHASFFQKMIAKSAVTSVPLVYAEAALFSDIFYYSTNEGAVLGALPTAFWNDKTTLAKYGVASMRGHAWTRVQDPALLTSTNNTYQFMQLDVLTNVAMRGNDSRLVLHRGFAEKQSPSEGVAFRNREENDNEELYEDDVENFSNIHKLTRLFEKSPPDYFYTQTANHSTAAGVKVLRDWVTSPAAILLLMSQYSLSHEDASSVLRQASAIYIERSWTAFIDLWMKYIIHSPEEPLGGIEWAWYRKEFQDDKGNVYHIHAMLKTVYDTRTPAGMAQVLDKIHGCKADLAAYARRHGIDLNQPGHLSCLKELLEWAERYLSHRCNTRCQVPKTNEDGNTVFVCKRNNNFFATKTPGEHTIQVIDVPHSQSALEILLELGYATRDIVKGTIKVTDPCLLVTKHVPRCALADAAMSPTNANLFMKFPSSQNLQNAQGSCLSLYLVSYVAGVDKGSIVLLRPPTKDDPHTIRAEHYNLGNTKINSVRKAAAEFRDSKRNEGLPAGRPVTLMECLSVIQARSLVASTVEFIKIPTCPREYRSAAFTGYMAMGPSRRQDIIAAKAVLGQTVRRSKNFPEDRLFSTHQMEVIRDELDSPLNTDFITIFSMRPPELHFVDNPAEYMQWFIRSPVCPLFNAEKSHTYLTANLALDVFHSMWLDGFNYQVRIRDGELQHVCRFAEERTLNSDPSTANRQPSAEVMQLLLFLKNKTATTATCQVQGPLPLEVLTVQNYLAPCRTHSKLSPVIWWSPVNPRRKVPFLVHLLLLYGRFETEYDLMLGSTLREAFIRGGLLDPENMELSFQRLLKLYVERELRVSPSCTFQVDRALVHAYGHLRELWGFPDAVPCHLETPPVLASAMTRAVDAEVEKHLEEARSHMVDAIYAELSHCGDLVVRGLLPPKASILNARRRPAVVGNDADHQDCDGFLSETNPHVPLQNQTDPADCTPIFPANLTAFFPPPNNLCQSQASFKEQTSAMKRFKTAVNAYFSGSRRAENIIFVGGPGVGKTTVASFCAAYCLAKGMNGISTSFIADRAKKLGGIHLHALLGLKGRDDSISPGRMAELAIQALYRQPHKIELIRRLDFIFIDEWGMMSAELMAVLDICFRYIRGESALFCGGVLIFGTMDHLQLMPFKGTPGMLSMFSVSELAFCRLVESVRAADDVALRRITDLTRLPIWQDADKAEFKQLLSKHCTFIDSFEDDCIPSDAVFLFGRKEPCYIAEALVLDKMRRFHGNACISAQCHDEESTTAGNWGPASSVTSKSLDRRVKQRSLLLFYPNARYEFTHVSKGQFNQGQLAIMLQDQVPTETAVSLSKPVHVWKAPSGVKQFPTEEDCNPTWLLTNGWSIVPVPCTTTQPQRLRGRHHARRTQYGLRPRVASTIHAAMGSTLPSIVTAVTSEGTSHGGLDFGLWTAALVVVLLSRTRRASHMFFVGDKDATITHLLDVLITKNNRFLGIITDLLDRLCLIIPTVSEPVAQAAPAQMDNLFDENHPLQPVLPHPTVFQPKDSVVANIIAVYHIISLQDLHFNYLGATINLRRRLNEHNSLQGSIQTKNPALLPFALFAYVAGFATLRDAQHFEHVWREQCRRRMENRTSSDPPAAFISEIGRQLLARENHLLPPGTTPLRMVQCGNLAIQR